eukprot:CAMPEP_0179341032 /NCGR_PEP_ID=MMETSP0797-20121207/69619_1 /TAXON_ID=47934 /ORGANISM="Dinophysis acuminata, Strain DAEP01" /LENGTH=57 /DNA_ID=CAMNT_0021055077 /DNA_START=13 /DNA_END=183 /DNA_ORIENTATION=-
MKFCDPTVGPEWLQRCEGAGYGPRLQLPLLHNFSLPVAGNGRYQRQHQTLFVHDEDA